jgi:alpha-glucosidase
MAVCANAVNLQSPDGNYVITLNGMTYSVDFKGHPIVRQSLLGVNVDNRLFESALAIPRGSHENWCDDLELKGAERVSVDTQWSPLYGENVCIRDCYNELVLHFEKGSEGKGTVSEGYDKRKYYAMDIIVRAYNEGVAFRYHFPETANGLFLHITGEQTSFAFPDGTLAWYEEWAQGPYEKRLLKGTWFESERPLLLQLPTGEYVALLEASLKDYTRGKFKLKKDNELQIAMYDCADVISPYDTPWRVMMVGERAVDLINNKDLVLNLNAERAAGDWSWVKPGKVFRAGQLSKKGIMSAIDFCSQFGFDYVELDAGWYGPEGQVASDATKVSDSRDFTMPEICAYAKSKGIGVWVYVNQRALYYQLDKLLPLYQQWGISGIKFGFVQIGNQQWTTWLHHAVAQCAAYRLMVDIHDEYRPTGLSRTYPHLLTQEGVCGNEEMPDATHNTLLPFTRYLCGPADYTLCYFNSRVKNTKGHQLAMAAVYYSPLQFYFWYDSPFVDQGESELQFWKDCPTVFDESVALDGIPGEYIIQARRSGHDWFVGAMTNTEGRTIQVPTDFLPKGKYIVEIFNDDPALNTRTKVSSQSIIIKAGKIISLELQPSGGATLHFKPMSK